MAGVSFKVVDRVRVHTMREVLADTCGLIHSRSSMASSTYFVLFDGWPEVKLMYVRDLEPITDERKSAPEA
jgi:hypothetical protein